MCLGISSVVFKFVVRASSLQSPHSLLGFNALHCNSSKFSNWTDWLQLGNSDGDSFPSRQTNRSIPFEAKCQNVDFSVTKLQFPQQPFFPLSAACVGNRSPSSCLGRFPLFTQHVPALTFTNQNTALPVSKQICQQLNLKASTFSLEALLL